MSPRQRPQSTHVLYPRQRPVLVDLFSGAGGMSLGFEQAGFDVRVAVEFDAWHAATHEFNFPYGVTLLKSVVDVAGDEIREAGEIEGEVDLVIGGPPCQGFSHMGRRDEGDPRNTLVDEFARIVSELQPRAFVMENVPGMQSGKTRSIFDRVVSSLEEAGYSVTPARILDARDFGVPQNRRRLFLMGLRADERGTLEHPSGPVEGQPERPTVGRALAGLPVVDGDSKFLKQDRAAYDAKPRAGLHYARIARGLEEDPSDAAYPRIWDRTICSGCLRVNHRPATEKLYEATPPGSMVPGHKLPRLSPEGVAPTLRAGTTSDRGSHTAPRPIHPERPRVITAREAARLHGFPDWFTFFPARYHAYRQIGNAVCPPVARAVGYKVAEALDVERWKRRPKAVRLDGEITLPDDRPKSHRRITQLAEFPKVVEHLFSKRFDAKKQRLSRAAFTTKDIERAIAKSGARMPRVSPDQFLADLARSRGVEQILAAPLARGFSIVRTKTGGRFVPSTAPDAIHAKDTISATSGEVHSAIEVSAPEATSASELLEHAAARKLLFGSSRSRLSWEEDPGTKKAPAFHYRARGKDDERGIAVVLGHGSAPRKSQIAQSMKQREASLAVVAVRLTPTHTLLSRLDLSGDIAVETARGVIQFEAKATAGSG